MKKHLVFVYGTLKRGYRNHWLLEGQKLVGPATTVGRFKLLMAGFPVLVKSDRRRGDFAQVQGELYLVTDECLASLDRLEGEGHMYRRKKIRVRCDFSDKSMTAWTYQGMGSYWRGRLEAIAAVAGQLEWGR
jgi:gamma-glutamylcyclotransferase (GGCT)/AIG2-like uncharacterized protein YtfP